MGKVGLMSEEKVKLENIVQLLMRENNTLKAALLESEKARDTGATLRDNFAGLAMQGYLSGYYAGGDSHEAIADESYMLADAMLKAREVDDE
jgi:hypothetical protein